MTLLFACMIPFTFAISYADDPEGGGGDPDPTEKEKKLMEKIDTKMK